MQIPKTRITIIGVIAVIIISVAYIFRNNFMPQQSNTNQQTLPLLEDGTSVTPVLSPVAPGIKEGQTETQSVKTYNIDEVQWDFYYYQTADGQETIIRVPAGETPPPGTILPTAE